MNRPRICVVAALFAALCAVTTALAAAEKITASSRLPADLPWNLAELSEPPTFEWIEKDTPIRSMFYAGEPYSGQATRVFAYYATPQTLVGGGEAEKKFPAVVLVHGGGGTAFRDWVELWAKRGYAAIAMDLAGHRPIEGKNAHQRENRTRLPDGGPDQVDDEKFGSIDQSPSQQWPYHAVASVVRAHSLIRSFPEVDATKTAVTGISWGGYLTCIVAGVDNRFSAAVPVYGCGYLYENSAWLSRFAKMTSEQKERWIALWDPSRYLPAVSMPILFVNGTNDFAYPLDSYMRSFEAVPGVKQIRITVNMPHGHPPGWAPKEIGVFIDHHLLGGDALPKIATVRNENGKIAATILATDLRDANLYYTVDKTPINQREWKTQSAEFQNNSITASAPPPETTAWFLTVTDARNSTISSPVFLRSTN